MGDELNDEFDNPLSGKTKNSGNGGTTFEAEERTRENVEQLSTPKGTPEEAPEETPTETPKSPRPPKSGELRRAQSSGGDNAIFSIGAGIGMKLVDEVKQQRDRAAADRAAELEGATACIIHPRHWVWIMWTMLQMTILCYMFFELPYRVAFHNSMADEMSEDDYKDTLALKLKFDRVIDFILLMEHFFSYFVAYYDEDPATGLVTLVTNKTMIAQHFYCGITAKDRAKGQRVFLPHTPYILDVISCMPVDVVIYFTVDVRLSFYFRLLLRMGRLKELVDLRPLWNHLLMVVATLVPALKDFTVMITLTFGLLCFTHVTACLLYFVGRPVYDTATCSETNTCGWVSGMAADTPPLEQYITAFYYAFTILTTVGFGDISAHAPAERVVTVMIMLCGAYTFAVVMGNISAIIIGGNVAKQDYDKMITKTMHFCSHRSIKRPLRRQIDQFFRLAYPDQIVFDEIEVLSRLPPMLRTEVMLDMYEEVMESLPFLPKLRDVAAAPAHEDFDDWYNDLVDIRVLVCQSIGTTFFLAGEDIVHEGQHGDEMYVVIRGQVEVLVTDDVEESQIDATWIHQEHDKVSSRTTVGGEAGVGAKRAKPMKRVDIGGKNMFFGGIAAMTKGRRTATCRAHTFVTCAVLNYDGLEHVMLNHPSFKSAVADWVKGRKVMFDVKEKSPKSGDARASESDPRTAGDSFERHPQCLGGWHRI